MPLKFRKANIADTSALNLFNRVGENNWRTEFFSDLKPDSFLFIAEQDAKVTGVEGYIEYKMNFKGETILTHRSERTKVLDLYRGKGVFKELIMHCDHQAQQQGSFFCWGATTALKPLINAGFEAFTGFRSYIFYPVPLSLRNRIKFLFNHKQLLNPLMVYRTYKKPNVFRVKQYFSLFQIFRSSGKNAVDNLHFEDFDPSKANEFVSFATKNAEIFSLNLTGDLLNWLEQKKKHYFAFNVYMEGQYIGYVIYYHERRIGALNIVDVFVSEAAYLPLILKKLATSYRNAGIASVFLSLNYANSLHKEWVEKLRESKAFIRTKAGSFIIKNYTDRQVGIANLLLTDLWLEL